jgi:septum formation protein
MPTHLILASQSPRRQQLLHDAGFTFAVCPPHIDEHLDPTWTPEQSVCELSRRKGAAVVAELRRQGRNDSLVLAADTLVALANEIFGKPHDETHAHYILQKLSHHRHRVITGVCLWPLGRVEPFVAYDTTYVHMHPMSESEIQDYIRSGEGMDKAGAYALQESGERYVESIEGAFDNVIGLPVQLVKELLALWQNEQTPKQFVKDVF